MARSHGFVRDGGGPAPAPGSTTATGGGERPARMPAVDTSPNQARVPPEPGQWDRVLFGLDSEPVEGRVLQVGCDPGPRSN
jgi:hypothetical protein